MNLSHPSLTLPANEEGTGVAILKPTHFSGDSMRGIVFF
jgi:hypothetical protein